MIAEARFDPHGRVALRVPFNRLLVDSLKSHIPADGREYYRESRVWAIAAVWSGTAVSLARQAFPNIEIIEPEQTRPRLTVVGGRDDDWSVLHLRAGAPATVVDAVYRTLSRQYHPDLGGSTAAMQKLNAAYERLRSRRGRGAA